MQAVIKISTLIFFIQTLVVPKIIAQHETISKLSAEQVQRLDENLSRWDNQSSPGIAILVMQDKQVVYQKCHGLADVANNIPITPKTVFPLAEISAHFTAIAALYLDQQGKLDLDKSVLNYLKDLPDFYNEITLNDLLQHSSGIEDFNRLHFLAGARSTDLMTTDQILALLRLQKEPLFNPGSQTSDSPSNMLILAEVLSAATGKNYAQLMQDELFIPLGMSSTRIVEDVNVLIDNAAISYTSDEDMLKTKTILKNISGVNNIYSNLEDLIKWENHLNEASLLSADLIDKSCRLIEFEHNGRTIKSTGTTLGQIGYHSESGGYKSWLNGALGGYASCVTKVTPEGFTSYVFSNTGESYTGFISVRAALIACPSAFPGPSMIDYSTIKTISLTNKELNKFCGHYWNAESGLRRQIILENDTLRYQRTNGYITPLIPLSENRFQMMTPGDNYNFVEFDVSGSPKFYFGNREYPRLSTFESYQVQQPTDHELSRYEGTYINKMLDVVYNVESQDGKLILTNHRLNEIELVSIKDATFSAEHPYFSNIEFKKGSSSKVLAVNILWQGKKNMWLDRIEIP